MRVGLLLAGLLVVLATTACQGPGDETGSLDAATAAPAAAPSGDLCPHGVLAPICPKCHPKLAAVFQAKGDWCAEHGLPESVCPLCHPERGGRPEGDVSASAPAATEKTAGAPANGTVVRLKTPETARLVGIETIQAEERANAGGVLLTATLVYDATRVAQVNARSPGVVRALGVDVGAKVKKGAVLAELESAEVGSDRSRLEAARARVDVAEANYARAAQLEREGITSTRETLLAQQERAAARAERAGLASALAVVGAGGGAGGRYSLTAPLTGVVTRRSATLGRLVGIEELLFEVVDVSAMWAELDVPETELATIAPDQRVLVSLDGAPGRQFPGVVTYISPAIDPHTRMATARVPLGNPEGLLRANMFGRARVLVGGARTSLWVPAVAIQRAKNVELVFVRRSPELFEARHVKLGRRDGADVEVLQGVQLGEDVVTQGGFLLKTETLKDSIGAGCCAAD